MNTKPVNVTKPIKEEVKVTAVKACEFTITIPKENTKKSFIVLHNNAFMYLDLDGNILSNHQL